MCGIIGFWGEENIKKWKEILEKGWERLKHRGEDSYGVVIKTDKKIISYRSLSKESLLEKVREDIEEGIWDIENAEWVLAHNRKASVGGIRLELAHPIYLQERKQEDIWVIHNGTKRALSDAFGEDSDTKALPYVFTLRRAKIRARLLNGVGVAFCVRRIKNSVKILFHKDNSRPLVFNKEGIIASEPIERGDWFEINDIEFVSLDTLSEIEKLINPKKSLSVVVKRCIDCGREFVGGEELLCQDCRKSYTNYYSSYKSSYKSYDCEPYYKSDKRKK